MGVKNMSDLVLKEIYGICETKNLRKEQINKYKMTKREIYKKFGNLSENELNTKSNKNIYVRNERRKKRGIRAMDGFRKKLMIPDSEIPKCPEFEVKSKIGKLFMNEKVFEEYSVKIYETDPYFYKHYKEKIKVDNNEREYILFRIDVYFTQYFLAVEIDEQNHEDRDLIFEKRKKKRKEALEKKLGCKFIRINTSDAKTGYDTDYEVSKIQIFISKFIEKNKRKRKQNKRTRR